MVTRLTERFNLRFPIVQAPMANAAGGDLAREVTLGGGLGMIGTGSRMTAATLSAQWARLEGAGPVGIGLLAWALPGQQELFAHCLALHPAVLFFSFGDSTPYIAAAKAGGIPVLCQVQTVEDAAVAVDAGADFLITQGSEAGGHIGKVSALPLFGAVRRAFPSIPTIMAGGIADATGVAGAIAMGAAGAMLGTRYVATVESLYCAEVKQRIVGAGAGDTVVTSVFDIVQEIPWPAIYPGRVLANQFTDRWNGHEAELRASLAAAQADFLEGSARLDPDILFTYAGQAVGLIDSIVPARLLTEEIGIAAESLLSHLSLDR